MITCGSGHPLSCPELEKKIVKFCILPILRFIYTLHTTCAKKNIIQATKESYTDYLTFSSSHVKKVKRFYMFSQKFYHTITHYPLSYILSLSENNLLIWHLASGLLSQRRRLAVWSPRISDLPGVQLLLGG